MYDQYQPGQPPSPGYGGINNDLNASMVSQGGGQLAELDLQLFNRLLKVGIIRASPNIKAQYDKGLVTLDAQTSGRYLNGHIFANYLLVLKSVMLERNQDFSFDSGITAELKDQPTPQARLFNWNYLCNELEKIGIIVESDVKSLYVAGDSEEVGKLFSRIERYMKRISGDPEVLNFTDLRRDDRIDANQNKDSLAASLNAGRRGLQSTQRKPVKDGVDIMAMDVNRDPSETESTLEFILNTLCRALSMKPKQAAALLTNNNQFLTHCVVKGVKGRYEPMISWYQDIYQHSRHLSVMLEVEAETAQQSRDPKTLKASQQNFEKVLQTISCGCYSQNVDTAQLCLRTLACIARDFAGNIELVQLSMQWFQSKDNGLYTINYALKRHPELAEDFVTSVGNFTDGGDAMTDVYLNQLQELYPEIIDYFSTINIVFPYLAIKYAQELTQGPLLAQLVDRCVLYSGQGSMESSQVRVAALSLLSEIWQSFGSFIAETDKIGDVQSVFQRSSRDKEKTLRIVSVACMFKLLDKFSTEKYPAAPSLYKQLIFSLVESPQEPTVREVYLTNFQYLFESVKQIPIGLLLEPYIRLNQVQDAFPFITFDYDFLTYVAQHPKLNVQNSIQMLDLLARQYLNDLCNASVVAVPFMMLCSRFIGTLQCQEFIMKYITISLNQLLAIENIGQQTAETPDKSKPLALPAPSPGSTKTLNNRNPRASSVRANSKGKDFRISSSKKSKFRNVPEQSPEERVNVRLKKGYIIQMLLKLQNLRQDDVNNAMKDMLLSAQKQYRDQMERPHNGINAILKYWGEPQALFNQYSRSQEKIEAEERKAYEKLKRQEEVERRMLGYESDGKAQAKQGAPSPNVRSQSSSKKLSKGTANRNSLALMPIAENQQNLRALHELEMIKKYKKEKEAEEQKRHENDLRKQTLKQNKLKEELNRRRVEMGQLSNNGGVRQELKALIYDADQQPKGTGRNIKKFKNPIDKLIKLVDLEEEEDRDRELIAAFMKKYHKIWKYLHARYMNQMYSTKGRRGDFDDLQNKLVQISLPEVTKMLKDHGCYPQLLNKEELAQLIRLINMNSASATKHDLTMMDFPLFLKFIPQLAFLAFSRPPQDKSAYPPIASLQALLDTFEQATRDRGKSTAIYEDPDTSNFKDRELIQALEAKCLEDPSYPVPEGFKKVVEKQPIFTFAVPACARELLSEPQVIATELVDELLFDAIGEHFLEPLITFEHTTRVKPAIAKQGRPPANALSYMEKNEKKRDDRSKATAFAAMSAAEKRMAALEVKPKLSLALKLQVTKQDLKNRPHYQEVAEVFEEMLLATEKGLEYLPPRLNRAPGQVMNPAKLQKEADEKMALQEAKRRESERVARQKALKDQIVESNFGDRGLPINQYRQQKARADSQAAKQQELVANKAFQEKNARQKVQVQQNKQEQIDKAKEDQESFKASQEEELKRKASERKQFLARQKTKITQDFEDQYKRRDDLLSKEEEKKKLEKDNEDRLKRQMNKYIKDSAEDREIEKAERIEVDRFLQEPEVEKVFDDYGKQMRAMFDFYAAQDSDKDLFSPDADYLSKTLSFKELIRFGYQQQLTPDFISPDDLVLVYKGLIREQVDTKEKKEEDKDSYEANPNTAGMLDYDAFKKALVRISVLSQEKLRGEAGGDQFRAKLEADTKKRTDLLQRQKTVHAQQLDTKKGEQEKLESLKSQFQQEQQRRDSVLSKKATLRASDSGKTSPRSNTLTQKQRDAENQYRLDAAKVEQEEEFFKKWLKQRENLGIGNEDDAASSRARLASTSAKKKDQTAKELNDLDKKLQGQERLKNLKFEKKTVRKKLDVGIITADTIAALMGYLQLDTGAGEAGLKRTLTLQGDTRKGSIRRNTLKAQDQIPEDPDEQLDRGDDIHNLEDGS